MQWTLAMPVLVLIAAVPDALAPPPRLRTFWVYLEADSSRWCAVTDAKAANAAASNGRFAHGLSAMVQFRADKLHSVMVMIESEDAYVEDLYTFDKDLRVSALVRRGRYIEDPFLSVTFRRDATGKSIMTAPSARLKRQQERAGRETYFVDWPRYDAFGQLPFAGAVNTRSPTAVTRCCRAS